MPTDPALMEYLALRRRVDLFVQDATESAGAALRCEPGCAGCCVPGLTVSPVEAAAMRAGEGGADLPSPSTAGDGCGWLDREGRCRVYALRPLVCRTQGLGLAYPSGTVPAASLVRRSAGGLDVTHCPLNFEAAPPSPAATLDAGRIDQLLAVVNHRYCLRVGLDPLARVPLADL